MVRGVKESDISLHVGGGWGFIDVASVAGQRNIASQCPRNTFGV